MIIAIYYVLFITVLLSCKVSVQVTLMVQTRSCLSVGLSVYHVMLLTTHPRPSGLYVLPGTYMYDYGVSMV